MPLIYMLAISSQDIVSAVISVIFIILEWFVCFVMVTVTVGGGGDGSGWLVVVMTYGQACRVTFVTN